MYEGKTLFAQIMDFLPWKTFHRIVARRGGDHRTRRLSCAEQFRIMVFAQLTYRESLRDIESCLGAQAHKLYHLGLRQPVRRATLADANETRDWQIYSDFAKHLIGHARALYINDRFAVDLNNTTYALDATTIDLCLALFPWAPFQRNKAAVKVHTLLDLRGNIPSFIHISDTKVGDSQALDLLRFEPTAIYIMDRGYLDCPRLFRLHQAHAFFVTRARINTQLQRISSSPVEVGSGVLFDETVRFDGQTTRLTYPDCLRRIGYRDSDGKKLVFLTNNFTLPASTVCALYKCRWEVELFFKWMKQHLRIKKFYGVSENAVKTQIWIAVSAYVLIAIVKKTLGLSATLNELLQILSITLFEKMPLQQALTYTTPAAKRDAESNQLNLFGI